MASLCFVADATTLSLHRSAQDVNLQKYPYWDLWMELICGRHVSLLFRHLFVVIRPWQPCIWYWTSISLPRFLGYRSEPKLTLYISRVPKLEDVIDYDADISSRHGPIQICFDADRTVATRYLVQVAQLCSFMDRRAKCGLSVPMGACGRCLPPVTLNEEAIFNCDILKLNDV
jgi:hypothetical protein